LVEYLIRTAALNGTNHFFSFLIYPYIFHMLHSVTSIGSSAWWLGHNVDVLGEVLVPEDLAASALPVERDGLDEALLV
jgi:hypothetical protein